MIVKYLGLIFSLKSVKKGKKLQKMQKEMDLIAKINNKNKKTD